MANLVINTYCNLKCPYCFAEDEKKTYTNKEMSEENFKKAVEWITRSDRRVGLIGGEPTLHSNFNNYLMYLINNPNVDMIMLYTNGTNLDKYKVLLSNYKVRMLVNLNAPEILGGDDKLQKILNSVEEISKLKKENGIEEEQIIFGLNLYKSDQDYQFFIDTLKRFNQHHCRMSVSIENTCDKNYNALLYFRKMKDTLTSFLWDLIKIECCTTEDCNFIPRCIFEETELDTLNAELRRVARKYNIDINYVGICEKNCVSIQGAPMDIHPDLTCSKCFGCSEYDKRDIFSYDNWQDLNNYFQKSITNFSRIIPLSNECTEKCKYYNNCYAGCMKYKLNKIDLMKKYLKF